MLSLHISFIYLFICVIWLSKFLQVQAYYGFQPLTAYLAVNYLHRFLCSGSLPVRTCQHVV